jgi:hypothetical protein
MAQLPVQFAEVEEAKFAAQSAAGHTVDPTAWSPLSGWG